MLPLFSSGPICPMELHRQSRSEHSACKYSIQASACAAGISSTTSQLPPSKRRSSTGVMPPVPSATKICAAAFFFGTLIPSGLYTAKDTAASKTQSLLGELAYRANEQETDRLREAASTLALV